MKRNFLLSLFSIFFVALQAQVASNLDATAFYTKLNQTPAAQIVDVRTPGEFAQGIIPKSVNIDISTNSFPDRISKLDKKKPVFVYCLTGSRSVYAMNYMKSIGFTEIYNLAGGILRWRAARFPEVSPTAQTAAKPAAAGMSMTQYQALFNTNKIVIINFAAEWCAPCKRMKPYLDELARDYKDKLIVVRIDADANKTLLNELKIENVPTLSIYKNKKHITTYKAFVSKEEVLKHIEKL